MNMVINAVRRMLALNSARERRWNRLGDSHGDPEEDIDIKDGDVGRIGEVFEKTPYGSHRKSAAQTPNHGLNED
jgi:hypothetical protein